MTDQNRTASKILEFAPESPESMSARFQAALEPTYDYRDSIPKVLPSDLRQHVFDYQDGLRLMVSRDLEDDSAPFLHLSASACPGTVLYKEITLGRVLPTRFLQIVRIRFEQLSGKPFELEFNGFSPTKGVPHWRQREEVENV